MALGRGLGLHGDWLTGRGVIDWRGLVHRWQLRRGLVGGWKGENWSVTLQRGVGLKGAMAWHLRKALHWSMALHGEGRGRLAHWGKGMARGRNVSGHGRGRHTRPLVEHIARIKRKWLPSSLNWHAGCTGH